MNKISLITSLVFVIISLSVKAQINKVPATKRPIEYKQPDGTTLTIFLKGDEHHHCAVTSDGYTLLSNSENGYEYAKLDKKKNLVSSKILAHAPGTRQKKEIKFLKKTPKNLWFSDEQMNVSKQKYNPME